MRPDGSHDYNTKETLFKYDFPRAVYERRKWVITWRIAKFQCQFPKYLVTSFYCFYHRKANVSLWKIPLDKLVAAKRMVTQITNAMEASVSLRGEVSLSRDRFAVLNSRLFQIRDGIIALMGDYRTEWRKRYGA